MQITVLGKSPAWQDAAGACSGYLLEEQGELVMLDCGNGVFAKLRERIDYYDLSAIFISHLHADHFFDLIPYAYALMFSPRSLDSRGQPIDYHGRKIQIYAPRGAEAVFTAICKNFHNEPLIDQAFDLHEYEPGDILQSGVFSVEMRAVPHWVPTCAMDVTTPTSGRVTYGADCAPNDAVVDLATDTDLLILEATLEYPEPEPRGHLTAMEAGEHAARACARRLVLTHITDELDSENAREQASAGYDGPIQVAKEFDIYEV
ncbi:MAG TPA: MBL fold metallo-hydrolase [Baekduia sp.]|nr:MBL fold metallo-hydrolase [Baekduia sp.]